MPLIDQPALSFTPPCRSDSSPRLSWRTPGRPGLRSHRPRLTRGWPDGHENACNTLELPVTSELRKTIVGQVDLYDGLFFAQRLSQLQETAINELKARLFLFVPTTDAGYYRQSIPLGTKVDLVFPDTRVDSVEAAKCLALDRSTATVFHLMRVLEAGVKAFAAKLSASIDVRQPWGNILGEANKAIQKLPHNAHQGATQEEIEFHRDCQELSAGLNAIKDAWRNPTMHDIAASYQKWEAVYIFTLACAFMERLAKIV